MCREQTGSAGVPRPGNVYREQSETLSCTYNGQASRVKSCAESQHQREIADSITDNLVDFSRFISDFFTKKHKRLWLQIPTVANRKTAEVSEREDCRLRRSQIT